MFPTSASNQALFKSSEAECIACIPPVYQRGASRRTGLVDDSPFKITLACKLTRRLQCRLMTRQPATSSPPTRVKKDRIAELLAPFIGPVLLSESQLDAIQAYLDLLLRWNSKLNLTAIRDPQEIVTRHFGESLFAARQLFPAADSRETAIDVGSGAGFPGLPLKLWSPSLNLTLIESNQRKATFLREVVRTLNLNSVSVLTERAESISLQAVLVTFPGCRTVRTDPADCTQSRKAKRETSDSGWKRADRIGSIHFIER